jgi:hypothetical protein
MAKAKPTRTKPQSPKPAETTKQAPPVFDQTLAASTAAALIGRKLATSLPVGETPSPETSTFKQLKESLNKPHANAIGGMLDKSAPANQKKSTTPFNTGKQVGHNQTVGSDVVRRNVPRRTGG